MRNKQRVATMGLAVVASVAVLGGTFAYLRITSLKIYLQEQVH